MFDDPRAIAVWVAVGLYVVWRIWKDSRKKR